MTAAPPGTAAGRPRCGQHPSRADRNISYVVDPALRRHGYGTSIIAALLTCPQLAHVSLFVAGVEPANAGSISCLLKNGFQPLDPTPDWEGTVYYAKGGPPA